MSPNPESTRSGWARWLVCMLLVTTTMLVGAPVTALAQPASDDTVPLALRQYVPDSPEWQRAAWMTTPPCRDRGGDFSMYSAALIRDMVPLLEHFQPDFANIDANAPERKEILARGYRDIATQLSVPAGYCVASLRQWARPNAGYKPFGFEWGAVEYEWGADTTEQHGVYPFAMCSRTQTSANVVSCRGFYISCDGATSQQDHLACETWNAFSDDYVLRMNTVIKHAYDTVPAVGGCPQCITTRTKTPGELAQEFLDWSVKKGMEQVVSFVVSGVTKLWAAFVRITIDLMSPAIGGVGFTSVYNLVAGVALSLAFLGWLVTLAGSWRRGHMAFALFGGVKAAAGVTLAAVGAILMLQLADECTKSLVTAGGDLVNSADVTASLAKVNPLVAVIAGAVMGVSLLFAVVFLVVHPALVLIWALFGSIAAAGQVHPASSGWLLKWASRLTALAWVKFFMVAVLLLAQALLLPIDSGDEPVRQVVDVVQGLAVCVLMVSCPYLLWELVDFVGDRVGGAGHFGGPATRSAGDKAGAVGGRIATTTGTAVTTAISTLLSSSSQLAKSRSTPPTAKPPANVTSGSGGGGLPPQVVLGQAAASSAPRPAGAADRVRSSAMAAATGGDQTRSDGASAGRETNRRPDTPSAGPRPPRPPAP